MILGNYLLSRGLSRKVIKELLPCIPEDGADGVFCDAASIMDPDRWFYWPGQTRFVPVGQCPNGDAVAIDTQKNPGAVYYVAHELLGRERPLEDAVIRVADSPSDFVQRFLEDDGFPYDFFEAKGQNTEPGAPPNGGPATQLGNSGVTDGPPSESRSFDDMTMPADIPTLPGHHGIVRRRFIAAWVVCSTALLLGVLIGRYFGGWASLALAVVFVLAFCVGVAAFLSSKRAQCPRCQTRMRQGWDESRHSSMGVFCCPACHSQWRTDAVFNFGGE